MLEIVPKQIKIIIKKNGWNDIPIIGLTGNNSIEAKEKYINAVMIKVFSKPISFETIMRFTKNEVV